MRREMMGFWDAVALAGPYANNLHLAPDRQPHQHLITQFLQARCSSWHRTNSASTDGTLANYTQTHKHTNTHTQTHTHTFNGPFSGTTQVSRYQKGRTNLDFTEASDSEWQWHQLGQMQVCTLLQTDNHTSIPPLSFFTGGMLFLPPNQQHQSTEALLLTSN